MSQSQAIYLDNAATTRVDARVAALVTECMLESFGNPASVHQSGIAAERRIKTATRQLAAGIGDPEGKHGRILWTSGGTESDALGVLAAGRAHKKARKVIVSQVEHPAVKQSAALLCELGWELLALPVNTAGVVTAEQACELVDDKVGVLALMLINNEIGTEMPVAEVARAVKAKNPRVHVHCDAVQALGKIPIDVVGLGVDSAAFAAHKLHGPKGVGALWLRAGARLRPFWAGGGQQDGLRSGTENVPGIAGMGLAVEIACEDLSERHERHREFANALIGACDAAALRYQVNGGAGPRGPHVLSLGFDACPAEPLLHVLESRGILVSAGSACSERSRKPSQVLQAIGVPESYGTVRLSFGRDTTSDEIAAASAILVGAVQSFQS